MKTGMLLPLLAICIRVGAVIPLPQADTSAPASGPWPLDKCLEYAGSHNHELLAGAASGAADNTGTKTALAQLAPSLSVKGGLDNYWKIPVQVFPGELVGKPPGTFVPVRMGTPWMGNYSVEANVPLVDPKIWQDIRMARLRQQAGTAEYSALQQHLIENVSMAWYMVQLQEAYLAVMSSSYQNYQEIHTLIGQQLQKGLTDKITFNQSAVLLKTREDALLKAGAALQEASTDLKFRMGYPMYDSLAVPPLAELPTPVVAGFNSALLPDYAAETLKVKLAEHRYRSARTSWYPSLRFTGSLQQLGFGNQLNFITKSPWYTVGFAGIQLQVPLSVADIWHKPHQQKQLWQQAVETFKQYESTQQKACIREKLQLEQAMSSVRLQEEKVTLAEENEALSTQKIRKGIIDMIQLREVQKDLYEAQARLNEARQDFFQHYTTLNYLQNK